MGIRVSRDFEGLSIATEDWPIILMDFPEHRVSDGSLEGALRHIEDLLIDAKRSHEMTYQITDISRMHELAPASQRKYAREWMKRTLSLQREASLGGANVTPSAILRGLITAVNWFQEPTTPTVFVATRKEALATAMMAFDDAHIRMPSEVRVRVTKRLA